MIEIQGASKGFIDFSTRVMLFETESIGVFIVFYAENTYKMVLKFILIAHKFYKI
jgi:hypothetical protein